METKLPPSMMRDLAQLVEGLDETDQALLRACLLVLQQKGNDYTVGQAKRDRIWNFRTVAEESGVTLLQGWYVYFFKHWTAVRRYVKEGRVESEPIYNRIIDCINYLFLLNRIIEDRKIRGESDAV